MPNMEASNICQYPELFIGLVAPVGVDLDNVEKVITDYLKHFKYKLNLIRISTLIRDDIDGLETQLIEDTEADRIDSYMTAGDEARERTGRGDLFSLLATYKIYQRRINQPRKESPLQRTAHIFRSLKHPDEVELFRNIYGDGFYLLGISSSRPKRLDYLTKRKNIPKERAEKLIDRDESEEVEFGQRTRDVFHLSDCFINIDAEGWEEDVARFLDLIFGNPYITPTRDEYAMFLAFAASLRSGDLSRQVGAVITSSNQEIISTGANDVPRYGGGLYWPDDKENDLRDFNKGYDSNEQRRNDIVVCIMKKIMGKSKNDEYLLREGKKAFKDTGIFDITEYGRAVHAEMEALLACARSGVSPWGGSLYCTTFPCHNCAKHIISAGISRVVFVEPYAKSQAMILHSDAIALSHEKCTTSDHNKVIFEPFVGIGPRKFFDLFSMKLSSGANLKRKKNGKIVKWERSNASVRVPLLPISYIEREELIFNDLITIKKSLKGEDNVNRQ